MNFDIVGQKVGWPIINAVIFCIRNLVSHGLKCFLDFAHFLAQKVSEQFLIFGKEINYGPKQAKLS